LILRHCREGGNREALFGTLGLRGSFDGGDLGKSLFERAVQEEMITTFKGQTHYRETYSDEPSKSTPTNWSLPGPSGTAKPSTNKGNVSLSNFTSVI